MRFKVLATDYDGTLASDQQVSTLTVRKLRELKDSGRKCILVTGRELPDLKLVFPQYSIFDCIVAENGALLYDHATGVERPLGEAPPPEFIAELNAAGIRPLSAGKVIVATWEPHQTKVLEIIKRSGIERQVIFNKGAVMILPAGVTKATGLMAALHEMSLSPHNTVAIGDAENDSHLLSSVECGVAVSNALSALKEMAHWVTKHEAGKGVRELIRKLIANDLENICLEKQDLELGRDADQEKPFMISSYGSSILLSGHSYAGKTTTVAAFLEQLILKQYQFCLIDPEGDYQESASVIKTGDAHNVPDMDTILEILKNPAQSCLVCTLGVPFEQRPQFFSELSGLLLKMQQELSHPHWIILDEVHHMFPTNYAQQGSFANFGLINTMMVTLSPEYVHEQVLKRVSTLVAMGKNTERTFQKFAERTKQPLPTGAEFSELKTGEALVWQTSTARVPFLIKTPVPLIPLQRHKRKYLKGDLGEHSFYFTGSGHRINTKAQNLLDFLALAETLDPQIWEYHLKRNDFSNWFSGSLQDKELAARAKVVEKSKMETELSKNKIKKLIQERYTGPAV